MSLMIFVTNYSSDDELTLPKKLFLSLCNKFEETLFVCEFSGVVYYCHITSHILATRHKQTDNEAHLVFQFIKWANKKRD